MNAKNTQKEEELNSLFNVNDINDINFKKSYLLYLKETILMTHTLEYEDLKLLIFFLEESLISNGNVDRSIDFPKEWFPSLGYEPFGDHNYIVLKNKDNINVFNDLSNNPTIYPYILFLIEEGQYIALS